MANRNSTGEALYHDVSPERVRYTRFYAILTCLICIIAIICSIIQAQHERNLYTILISLLAGGFLFLCINYFFQRRILLAEKLWIVILTITIWLLQSIIYIIFVFLKPPPHPHPISSTTIFTTPASTTSFNTTNMTNITSTTTTTTMRYSLEKQAFLIRLFEHVDEN